MNATTPRWVDECERLFPELLERVQRDPERNKSFSFVLDFYPRDEDKIAMLQFAHLSQLAPDDPAFVAIVRFLSTLLFLNEQRLEPGIRNPSDLTQQSADTVHAVNGDMKKYAQILTRASEKTVDGAAKLDGALQTLAKQLENLGDTLDEASLKRLEAHLNSWHELIEERVSEIIRVKSEPLVAHEIGEQAKPVIEALEETMKRLGDLSTVTVQMRNALVPAVTAINEMNKTVPFIDRWIKLSQRDTRVGAIVGTITLLLGLSLGYQLHKPEPYFTATPEIIRALTLGADYDAIKDRLDPNTRAKVDAAIQKYVAP